MRRYKCESWKIKKIDPALQFYSGIPPMIIDNTHIKEGRGNGTRCIGISVHLKKDCNVGYSNIDGRLVHTVSVLDLEYMVCEMIVENKTRDQKDLNYIQINTLLQLQ